MRRLDEAEVARFDHVEERHARRARVVVAPFVAPGVDGVTFGRVVVLRRRSASSAPLLAHELVHVRQWAELGTAGFLHRYLADYGRNLWLLRRHRAAYLAIPLEAEARAATEAWLSRSRPSSTGGADPGR